MHLRKAPFESILFYYCWNWSTRTSTEMLTLRTMVGGLQMTNNSLEQYIDELLAENNEIKEEMEELKRENWELKEQTSK